MSEETKSNKSRLKMVKTKYGCGKLMETVVFNRNGKGYYHPFCGEKKGIRCQECLDETDNKEYYQVVSEHFSH